MFPLITQANDLREWAEKPNAQSAEDLIQALEGLQTTMRQSGQCGASVIGVVAQRGA